MYLTIVIGDRQPFTIATRGRDHAIELVVLSEGAR